MEKAPVEGFLVSYVSIPGNHRLKKQITAWKAEDG
jgi:hypothetical protein